MANRRSNNLLWIRYPMVYNSGGKFYRLACLMLPSLEMLENTLSLRQAILLMLSQ